MSKKHHYVEKGWGSEELIVNKKEYCGKLLKFTNGKKCSVHYHVLKDETFYLHKGRVEMHWIDPTIYEGLNDEDMLKEFDEKHQIKILEAGDSFYVPQHRVHQVVALEDSEVFEFSTIHFDSDSYRLRKGD
jgi:quercetin dioxygenase-like cupin family protein